MECPVQIGVKDGKADILNTLRIAGTLPETPFNMKSVPSLGEADWVRSFNSRFLVSKIEKILCIK